MKNKFKIFGGTPIEDVGKYAKDYLSKHENVTVYVGTDSNPRTMWFATVVLFYHKGAGGHYILRKFKPSEEERKQMRDKFNLFSRLYYEANASLEVATYLEETLAGFPKNGRSIVTVNLDINPSMDEESHVAFSAAVGLLKGMNFEFRTKPNAYAASSAADTVVN